MTVIVVVLITSIIVVLATKISYREEFKIKKHYKNEEIIRTKETGCKVKL